MPRATTPHLDSSINSQRCPSGRALLRHLDDGKSCQAIAEFLYLDDDTIRGWYKTYREDGWDALAFDGWKGGQSRMSADQEAVLCDWLKDRFCRSTVEIRAHISEEFGLHYSHSGCIKLLARLGFKYRKPKALPRVASAEKQASFIAMYQSLLAELGADEAVYFAERVSDLLCMTDPVHASPKGSMHDHLERNPRRTAEGRGAP